jgi:hypothetical protein
MATVSFFTEKAAQCRRLAASINDDRAAKALSAMAEEFEELAADCTIHDDSEQAD